MDDGDLFNDLLTIYSITIPLKKRNSSCIVSENHLYLIEDRQKLHIGHLSELQEF